MLQEISNLLTTQKTTVTRVVFGLIGIVAIQTPVI